MADTPVIEAVARTGTGKGAARSARREGLVPGVIYGGGEDPQTINIKHNVLLKALKAGKFMSTLVNLKVDGQDNRVICRAVQKDVVKDLPTHADFLRLSARSRINRYIPLDFQNDDNFPGLQTRGDLQGVLETQKLVPDGTRAMLSKSYHQKVLSIEHTRWLLVNRVNNVKMQRLFGAEE